MSVNNVTMHKAVDRVSAEQKKEKRRQNRVVTALHIVAEILGYDIVNYITLHKRDDAPKL